MSEDNFIIRLNDPVGIYSPGYTVDGRVELNAKKEVKVKEIRVVFFGYSEVMWKIRHNGELYVGKETFFEKITVLVGGENKEETLPSGSHSFPFAFQIPEGMPSSVETPHAKIRYTLLGVIDRPWSFNQETKTFITVLDMLDLNRIPGLMNATKFEDSQSNRFCCKIVGPVTCAIKTDRKGYVPGESITFGAEVNNIGNNDMEEVTAQLVMEGWYVSEYNSEVVKKTILYEIPHGHLPAGGSSVWRDEKLPIPPVPPSMLNRVKNLDIKYSVAIYVRPSGPGKDFYFPQEVVIGSIPLADIASQKGISLSTDVTYDIQTTPRITKAVYMESILGKQRTKNWRQTFDHQGMQEFAPMYPYYTWEIRDPAGTFKVETEF